MDEELLQLLSREQQAPAASLTAEVRAQGEQGPELPQARLDIEQPEQELTPELRRRVPVVNRARGDGAGRRLQGITNFFENPEAQNALLQFGRAFANNDPTQAGTIIADAGEDIIRGQAEQRALEAFERGEDVASAAGRFARPELVADLQGRAEERRARAERLGLDEREFAQRQQEFSQRIDLAERAQELEEMNAENDLLLRRAALDADAEQFEKRFELLQQEQKTDALLAESRIAYEEAQIEALENPDQSNQQIAAQTNRFLETLGTKEQVLQEKARMLKDEIGNIRGVEFQGVDPETGRPQLEAEGGILDAFRSSESIQARAKEDPAIKEAARLAREYVRTQSEIQSIQNEQELLRRVQTARLGGAAPASGEGGEAGGGEAEGEQGGAVGTIENPVSVTGKQDALSKPEGSIVLIEGIPFRRTGTGLVPAN